MLKFFRVASDFQEFLQRFDEVLVQSSKLGQVLWLRAFVGVAPSFKETRDFRAEQRESESSWESVLDGEFGPSH